MNGLAPALPTVPQTYYRRRPRVRRRHWQRIPLRLHGTRQQSVRMNCRDHSEDPAKAGVGYMLHYSYPQRITERNLIPHQVSETASPAEYAVGQPTTNSRDLGYSGLHRTWRRGGASNRAVARACRRSGCNGNSPLYYRESPRFRWGTSSVSKSCFICWAQGVAASRQRRFAPIATAIMPER